MTFGLRLRYFRKKQKLSQRVLGEIIDKPQTTISDWEVGKTLPDVDEVLKLSMALKIPVIRLLKDNNDLADQDNDSLVKTGA